MAEIALQPKTSIRIITRALELLDEFNASLRKKMVAGEIKLSTALQIQSRKNAEEERKLRTKLADLKVQAGQEKINSKTSDTKDVLIEDLSLALLKDFESFAISEDGAFTSDQNTLRITRKSDDILILDLVVGDTQDLDKIDADLSVAIFSTTLEISSGPNVGTALFMLAPAEASPDLPDTGRARSFQVYIANGE